MKSKELMLGFLEKVSSKVLDQLIAEMGRDYLATFKGKAIKDEINIGIEHRVAGGK